MVSGEFPTFRVNALRLIPTYLMAFFSNPWLWEIIAGQSSGTSQVSRLRFKEQEFLRLTISLPPLEKQERIAGLLEEADELRKRRADADRRTAELVPALFHQMLGDPLNRRWPIIRLGEALLRTGQRDPRLDPDAEFFYVDIASVDNQRKAIESAKRILGKDAPSRARKVIQQGDVIVSTVRPNLNAVALVPASLHDQICSTGFSVLRPSRRTTSDYIFAFVSSPFFVEQLVAKTKGANYPAVGENAIKDVPLPIPPLSLQEEFSKRVNEIREIKAYQASSGFRLDALFQSLLHHAFNGEL